MYKLHANSVLLGAVWPFQRFLQRKSKISFQRYVQRSYLLIVMSTETVYITLEFPVSL